MRRRILVPTVLGRRAGGGAPSYLLEFDASTAQVVDEPITVPNANFDDTSAWTVQAGWSIANGVASCDGLTAGSTHLYQNIGLNDPDAVYRVEFDVTNYVQGRVYSPLIGISDSLDSQQSNGHWVGEGKDQYVNGLLYIRATTTFEGDIDNIVVTKLGGGLSNKTGDPWTVVRSTEASYKNLTTGLTKVAANFPKIDGAKVIIEPAQTMMAYNTEWTSATSGYLVTRLTTALNGSTAPDGTTTADRITVNADNAFGAYLQRNHTPSGVDKNLTISCFVKYVNNPWVALFYTYSGASMAQYFNVQTGAKGVEPTVNNTITFVASGIEDYGDGWYRIWMTVQDSQNALQPGGRVEIVNGDGDTAVTIGEALDIWGFNFGEGDLINYCPNISGGVPINAAEDLVTVTIPITINRVVEWINGIMQTPRKVYPGSTFQMLNGTSRLYMDEQITDYDPNLIFQFIASELSSISGGTIPAQVPNDGSADFSYTGTPTLSNGSLVLDASDNVFGGMSQGLINSREGTLIVQGKLTADDTTVERIGLSDNSANNGVWIQTTTSAGQLAGRVRIGGVDLMLRNISPFDPTIEWRAAVVWKDNRIEFWINGDHRTPDVTDQAVFAENVLTTLDMSSSGSSQPWQGNVKEIKVYDKALPQDILFIETLSLGPEILADPLLSDPANYTLDPGWSIANGVASFDGITTGYIRLNPLTPLEAGEQYLLEAKIETVDAGAAFTFVLSWNQGARTYYSIETADAGTHIRKILDADGANNFQVYGNAAQGAGSFSSISLRKIL